jgi:hypothetical protein
MTPRGSNYRSTFQAQATIPACTGMKTGRGTREPRASEEDTTDKAAAMIASDRRAPRGHPWAARRTVDGSAPGPALDIARGRKTSRTHCAGTITRFGPTLRLSDLRGDSHWRGILPTAWPSAWRLETFGRPHRPAASPGTGAPGRRHHGNPPRPI